MTSLPTPARGEATFLLADISGYTGFLNGIEGAHRALILEAPEPPKGYTLLSSLLDAMLQSLVPRFRLAKLEGDAVFAVADDPAQIRGGAIIDCLRACHDAFLALVEDAKANWTCNCGACSLIHDLGLKFVVHHGRYVVQRIVGNEELAGPDVIVVHRLLKNHARDVVGNRPYALLSDATVTALDVPTTGMTAAVEAYDDMPPIPVHVLPLD